MFARRLLICCVLSFIFICGCGVQPGKQQPQSEPVKPADVSTPNGLNDLAGRLTSDSEPQRQAAVSQLHESGKNMVPALIKMLDSPDAETRLNAAVVLGEIGPPNADPAMEKLRELAENDPDESVRKAAQNAVKQIETRF